MPQFGDAVVYFPVSGSSSGSAGAPPGVLVRIASQASHTTNYVTCHPGGSMTGSLMLVPRNNNRIKLTIINSGSLALAIDHDDAAVDQFNPNVPMSPTNDWDNVILGTVTLQGNQGVTPAVDYIEYDPVYTGPIFGAWIGSGSLSGSVCCVTDYTA